MKITFDITERFKETLLTFAMAFESSDFSQIKRRVNQIMSSIDDLQAAITNSENVNTAGFQAVADALTELSGDVSRLNDQIQNPPVEGITAQLQTDAQAAADKFSAVAEAIRGAIATPDTTGGSTGGSTDGSTASTDNAGTGGGSVEG